MAPIPPGRKAPAFSAPDQSGTVRTLAEFKGRAFVLYFYPKDDTPGCTKEACAFRDALPRFGELGTTVYGVSADNVASHAKFVAKFGLNFPLLADPERQLIEGLGFWVEKSMYGKKYMGIQRATVVVDATGKVEQLWPKVSPDAHAAEVAAYLAGEAAPKKSKAKTKT
jgi:peroxiredoxin Q/BCP